MSEALTRAVHGLMREASERAIMPHYQSLSPDQIDAKAADDVVTIADHEAEAILSEGLAKLLPEAAIVGEEACHADPALMDRLGDDLCWIIDPLDGTNNFAFGKPPFGVLVALAEKGETVAGWIYDCLTGRFCHAQAGKGAFVDGERIVARTSGQMHPSQQYRWCSPTLRAARPSKPRSPRTIPASTSRAAPPSNIRAWRWG